jgi:hypothetical protein
VGNFLVKRHLALRPAIVLAEFKAVVSDDDDDGVVTELEFIERIQHAAKLRVGETHRGIVAVADLSLRFLIKRAVGIRLAEDFVVR